MNREVAVSALIVLTVGSVLHFTWEWSGRNTFVAVFSATNESTWEHLKMAFWPAASLTPFHRWFYGQQPGFLPGTAVRCLLSPLLIVGLFHGYTAVLGTNYLALDIGIFAIAIFAAEWAGHRVLRHAFGKAVHIGAAILLVLAIAAFAALSFMPPENFLFQDPRESRHYSAEPR